MHQGKSTWAHSEKPESASQEVGTHRKPNWLAAWSQTSLSPLPWDINYWCLSHSVHDILLRQPKLTNKMGWGGRGWRWRSWGKYRGWQGEMKKKKQSEEAPSPCRTVSGITRWSQLHPSTPKAQLHLHFSRLNFSLQVRNWASLQSVQKLGLLFPLSPWIIAYFEASKLAAAKESFYIRRTQKLWNSFYYYRILLILFYW